jgi:hypothetical protein
VILHQLDGHEKDLGGGFLVRRLLPHARQRSVGPFIFFDHFGPAEELPGVNHDVRPHPHIGLATVTYLFDGAMMHRDSLGTRQLIEPGAINWMTSGSGIVHSERRPDHLRDVRYMNHGLQLWTALPLEHEETEPSFSHTPADAIPECSVGDARVRVLVGEASRRALPVPLSPTLYLTCGCPPAAAWNCRHWRRNWRSTPSRAHWRSMAKPCPNGRWRAAAGRRRAVGGTGRRGWCWWVAPLTRPRHMWWNSCPAARTVSCRPARPGGDAHGNGAGDTEFHSAAADETTPPEPRS